jgi:hypothetical protein
MDGMASQTVGKKQQAAGTTAVPAALPVVKPGNSMQEEIPLMFLPIQRKLSIGAVDDPLEQEADAMADKVMRMPEQPFVQRKCSHCEDEEQVQMKPLASSITPFIQTKGGDGGTASDAVTQQINSTRGSGSNMDRPTQSFMESRFGTDFSNVKIHTGDEAVQMSSELSAQAFTVGSDIYFNSGKYNPSSDSGKHLLAHELTHTVQQGGGLERKIQKNDTEEQTKDGLCIKSFFGGEVYFDTLSAADLSNIAVISEDDNGGVITPAVNGEWYNCDGFWYNGFTDWFKIPDHCKVEVASSPAVRSGFYSSCCNIAASLFKDGPHWSTDALDQTKTNPF